MSTGVAVSNWLGLAVDDPWGLDNLPYGVAEFPVGGRRVVVRVGGHVLDLSAAFADGEYADLFTAGTLDPLLAAGPVVWSGVREQITRGLSRTEHRDRIAPHLLPLTGLRLVLPFTVADYVDFYASEHHATNVGRLFRPDSAPLTPNWKHLPVGYHGRAGTVVVSDTDIVRPHGQTLVDDTVTFGPTRRLDIEAELGFVVGQPAAHAVPTTELAQHVFGVSLVNDWSARDIQSWEYVPLGPFLGKSFATSLSPWITPLQALSAAWTSGPDQDPEPLPYLAESRDRCALDITLEVRVNGSVVSRPPYAQMYWSPAQMLAHMTVNGATLRTGDLFASGTVSGPHREQRGSLLELSWSGSQPIALDDGSHRTFLEDGDIVTISATAPGPHGRLALGEVTGRIVNALAEG